MTQQETIFTVTLNGPIHIGRQNHDNNNQQTQNESGVFRFVSVPLYPHTAQF
jgi:hypothetical protein